MTNDETPRAYMPQSPPLPATFYYTCPGKGHDGRERMTIIGWEWMADDESDDRPAGWWPVVHEPLGERSIAAHSRRALGQLPERGDEIYNNGACWPAQTIVGIPFDIHYPDA